MRAILTGGLGHIGSSLVKELGEEHEITVLDNLSTSRYSSLFSDNLPKRGIRFVEGDICTHDLKGLFRGQDIVIHLAATTDATGSAGRPADVWWNNFHGTQRVADACVECGCALVFPSTTSVYGKSDGLVDEESVVKPQSPYAESKLMAEQYIQSLTDFQYVILRFGTIYGASRGMRFHTAANSFAWNATLGKPVTVWRTALHQKRPYLYLGDCLGAVRHVISKELYPRDVFNVLSGNHAVSEIVDEIRKHRNDLSVRYVDSPILNQQSYTVSYGKFAETGWRPHGTLEAGIAETMTLLGGIHR